MFTLDPKLDADTALIGATDLCQIRVMRASNYPWVILVPKVDGVREQYELSDDQQILLARDIATISRKLQTAFQATKMNVAALGNMVPQLHIHIIARFEGDPAWPNPVWGTPAGGFESENQFQEWAHGIKQVLTP